MNLWTMEGELHRSGLELVCGIDEAGRGPLAGPVYAAAVILPEGAELPGLDDSKKLSEKKREYLYDLITERALYYGIAYANEKEIDEYNILNAVYMAMNRAADSLGVEPDICLIDGNRNDGITRNSRCVIGGDAKCACIAAASILAKVTRDRVMKQLGERYPQYAFEKHKGYGTKLHYERIREFGPCEIHRKTFLKSCIEGAHEY